MRNQVSDKSTVPKEVQQFLARTPRPEFIEAFMVDINGMPRGKRIPLRELPQVYEKGMLLPRSIPLVNISGDDVEATGQVSDTGDRDTFCYPVPGSLRPVPWNRRPSGQVLLHMSSMDGRPFEGDPRTHLDRAVKRLAKLGLTAVMACEMEFYLFAPDLNERGEPVIPRICSEPGARTQLLSFSKLEALDELITEIARACEEQNLPMADVSVEQSEGMFEITLTHVDDPMLAADHAVLLKRTIKGCARRHGLIASFMAKPFGDRAGCGMHVHMSVLDAAGQNIFAAGDGYSPQLEHAVAGLLATLVDSTAVFAPHANSYRRYQLASHAPTTLTWGLDNRTTALRIPLSDPAATRVEHRVAGADSNPYLVLAALLCAIELGLSRQLRPPPPTKGNAYIQLATHIPDAWGEALKHFERSDFIRDCFGKNYQAWFTACKRQEREHLRGIVPPSEYDLYLQTV